MLRALLDRIADPDVDAAVLLDGDRLRPLPAAVRRIAALTAARQLRAGGVGRLREVFAHVRTTAIADAEWRRLDPAGASLDDIDTPADLARLAAREPG